MERLILSKIACRIGEEWDRYISLLCKIQIFLDQEVVDELCWSKNPKSGVFTTKLGYNSWFEDRQVSQPLWWWKPLWKLKSPLHCKLTLWLALKNKLLTWDNGLKRGWNGPNHCILCKSMEEFVSHIFIYCPYAGKVAEAIKHKLGANSNWSLGGLEDNFRTWMMDSSVS
jgi:hypothetical protein